MQIQEQISQTLYKNSERLQVAEKMGSSYSVERIEEIGNRTHAGFRPLNHVIVNMSNQGQPKMQENATNENSKWLLLNKLSSTPEKNE